MKLNTLILVVALIAVLSAAFFFQAYRDWAFIDENTTSRKGYREWFFGAKTNQWYVKSALEAFMEKHAPDKLAHRWKSYAGTGKNIFGMIMLQGHQRPGYVTGLLDLDTWAEKRSPAEMMALYDLLVSDDQDKIKKKVEEIGEEVVETKQVTRQGLQ